MSPKISVIIPTMKGREAMLEKLLSTLPEDCEKIVVGDDNLLLAAKRNKGARQAKGDYFLFIDDDNYVQSGALHWMQGFATHIGVIGMVACYSDKKLIIADGGSNRCYTSGFMKGINTNKKIYEIGNNCYQVDEVANAFMIPKEVFSDVGGFDEINFPIDLDEADICKRIKDMGYKVIMNARSVCYHNSQTYSPIPDFRRPMNAYFMGRNKVLFQKKHLSKPKFIIYFLFFLPIFLFGYWACLIYRGKPAMAIHFTKGVIDGLQGRFKNKYQQS
jgi:GT2 family glycosyltransferase